MQKVLIVFTNRDNVRAECRGWDWEDSHTIDDAFRERLGTYSHRNEMPVGFAKSWSPSTHTQPYCYATVLHAMADGWKLLAPPREYKEGEVIQYKWWLVKD